MHRAIHGLCVQRYAQLLYENIVILENTRNFYARAKPFHGLESQRKHLHFFVLHDARNSLKAMKSNQYIPYSTRAMNL